jgi:SAM-dependent methyltransferase
VLIFSSSFASKYTSEPWQIDILGKIDVFIDQNMAWLDPRLVSDSKGSLRVLDYACGPGTITHALNTHASEYVGVDLSENMVQAYNLRFNPDPTASEPNTSAIFDPKDETLSAHAVVGNLLSEKEPFPPNLADSKFFDFDLAAVGMGFHHFENIPFTLGQLAKRVKRGGMIFIVDMVTHDMEDATGVPQHTIAHAGFGDGELRQYFEDAGLVDFGMVKMEEEVMLRGTMKRRLFLARGRKP